MSKNKYCKDCGFFADQNQEGLGHCHFWSIPKLYGNEACSDFEPTSFNGWTEITPDNVEYIKEYERRIVIANSHHGSTFYRTVHDVNGIDSMAKQGGYYYYVLPELKLD